MLKSDRFWISKNSNFSDIIDSNNIIRIKWDKNVGTDYEPSFCVATKKLIENIPREFWSVFSKNGLYRAVFGLCFFFCWSVEQFVWSVLFIFGRLCKFGGRFFEISRFGVALSAPSLKRGTFPKSRRENPKNAHFRMSKI